MSRKEDEASTRAHALGTLGLKSSKLSTGKLLQMCMDQARPEKKIKKVKRTRRSK
jgi:phosphoribosylformylglycinamidine (FGAM) synthase PurS component